MRVTRHVVRHVEGYQPGHGYCGLEGGFLTALGDIEPTPSLELTADDVYWSIYNAVIELLHHEVPDHWWYTKDGRSLRHAIAGNAVQRLWDSEVHRDPGHR